MSDKEQKQWYVIRAIGGKEKNKNMVINPVKV